jgi:hypothetical protein
MALHDGPKSSSHHRIGNDIFDAGILPKRQQRDSLCFLSVQERSERFADEIFWGICNRIISEKYLKLIEEEPDRPNHAPSPFFVSCFSAHEDDLSQWRSYCGGENGYAIGFRASGLVGVPNSLLVKVNYDKVTHENIASQVAEATVRFFREGLEQKRADTAEKWEDEFLARWDPLITYLAPMVKDPGFSSENEYRIVHELQISELKDMKFIQKSTICLAICLCGYQRAGKCGFPDCHLSRS